MQYPINREFQLYSFPNFTGGLVAFPQQDNEAQTLVNMEPMRDGRIKTIYGSVKVNNTDLGGDRCFDIYVGGTRVNSSLWILLAATADGKMWEAHQNFNATAPYNFTEITPTGGLTGDEYWVFCQTSNTAGEQTILMCNETDGMYIWDISGSGDMEIISAAPPNPTYVCQYAGYTIALNGTNSIFISEYGDPETWPAEQEVAMSSSFGDLIAVVPIMGRVFVVCKYGLAEMRGTTFDELSVPVGVNSTIGSTFPKTVSKCGEQVAFLHYTGPYIYDTGAMEVQYIGEPIKELFTSDIRDLDLRDSAKYKWRGHLTKHHYYLTGPKVSDIHPRLWFIFDRRLNVWFEIQTPSDLSPWTVATSETTKVTLPSK